MDWVRLELDVDAFDEARFAPYLQACQVAGIEFTTLAELGDTTEHRRELWALNRTCSADIPDRGEFYTLEQYVAERIETPSFDPSGVALAIDGDGWVGMATTSLHPTRGFAFSEMTGVLPSHRGRGLSLALKLLAVRFTRSRDLHWLRTFHHPRNVSAIAMNRRLGFVDEDPHRWPS
ncbi:MAG: GNAT family N-acetyltransferase [Actinomycetota bacterium]|nr:GNAT family N-acetyltransferase [Actinomycetota bacterium]